MDNKQNRLIRIVSKIWETIKRGVEKMKSTGLGIFEVLGIVFVALKLTGVIGWSWWAVTSPFWMPILVVFVIYLVLAAIGTVAGK